MSERMLRFSDVNWAELITSEEGPIDLCLRKDVPAYFRVNRDHQRVRYHHRLRTESRKNLVFQKIDTFSLRSPSWKIDHRILRDGYVVGAFHDELLFLRLDNSSLAEIAISRLSIVSSFSDQGFSNPRPFRVSGHTLRGHEIKKYENIKTSILEKVEFEHAFLVDKESWASAPLIPPEGSSHTPEAFVVSVEVGESDLWFASTDIKALKQDAQQGRELSPYPFAHKEKMPGIHWMFQASYAHNELKILSMDGIAKWLEKKAPESTYRHRSIRTAKKFVQLRLDRAKGGDDRGEFTLEYLDEWTFREPYKFPFASKGLSCILAIADWWEKVIQKNPSATKLSLAEKLDENRFGGLEIGDLVYLISGLQVTEKDNSLFEKYLKENGKRVRRIIDAKPKKASSVG